MRIFNITSVPIVQNFSAGSNKAERPILSDIPADSFTFKGAGIFPLKEITHKSTEKLFNTDYVPQIEPKEGYYRTFVIDKNTGEYVDLYVRPSEYWSLSADSDIEETRYILTKEFDFYRKNNNKFEEVGYRTFNIDLKNNVISTGDMETFDKSLKGLGQRGHQLAVECLMQNGYKDIEILSVFDAYDFHHGCGFRVIDEFADTKETLKSGYVELWQKLLKTDFETVKNMLVYKSPKNHSQINLAASLGNFAQYANKNGIEISEDLIIPMKLTKAALKEWFSLSKLKPILK